MTRSAMVRRNFGRFPDTTGRRGSLRAALGLHAQTPAVFELLDVTELRTLSGDLWLPVLGTYFDQSELYSLLAADMARVSEGARETARSARGTFHGNELERLGALVRQALSEQQGMDAWSRLRQKFRFDDVELIDVRVDRDQSYGTATVVVTEAAIIARLDQEAGPAHWNLAYEHLGPSGLRCRLSLFGAHRDGFGGPGEIGEACRGAFRRPAGLFGIGRGLLGETTVSVDTDEEGRILNRPAIRIVVEDAGLVRL